MLTADQATAVAEYLMANTPGASGELDHSHISAWQMSCEALEALGYATETARGALLRPTPALPAVLPGGTMRRAWCSPLRSRRAGSGSGIPGPIRMTRPAPARRARKQLLF